MAEPIITLSCVANVFIRHMHFVHAGDIEKGHTHPFDHVTLVSSGAVEVALRGQVTRFDAPSHIFIKAEERHELIALLDGTVIQCIHALRDGDGVGDIIDPASIPVGANPISLAKSMVGPSL